MFPQVIRRRPNGKMGLCATPDSFRPLTVNGIARILETDGWECLNLGSSVSFRMVAEMVLREPVNLVCLVSTGEVHPSDGIEALSEVIEEYRLPVLLYGQGFESHELEEVFHDCQHFNCLSDLRHLCRHRSSGLDKRFRNNVANCERVLRVEVKERGGSSIPGIFDDSRHRDRPQHFVGQAWQQLAGCTTSPVRP